MIIPTNDRIKKIEAFFFFNNNNKAPTVHENTAVANAAVTQEGTS